MDNRPIGVFDSGLGGLTVLSELKKVLPKEEFIYFGDTARVPYGSKSKETIIKYSKEITNYLINQDVKMIVIACGTASSLAYDELKKSFDLPIINVITPTAININKKNIYVIATKATIRSNVWKKEILKYHKDAKVTSKACPLFVPIVEENLIDNKIADDAIDLYLDSVKKNTPDALILGCTHYPILIDKITNYLSPKTEIININKYCAKEVKSYLTTHKMLSNKNNGNITVYTTDNTRDFSEISKSFCSLTFDKVLKAKL